MNSLIIFPSECTNADHATLAGKRAAYAYHVHGVRTGQTIKVGVLGVVRGEALVVSASETEVELSIKKRMDALPVVPFDLIVGVSRPQTIKKVVQAAAMLGAESLHFVRSERGEKSYLQSRSLEPDELQDEIVKALEQVWDTRAPDVLVHRSFERFMTVNLPALTDPERMGEGAVTLIAHPGGAILPSTGARHTGRTIIAIGPERGWSDAEVARFSDSGFRHIGLGPRILRVEIALVYLMGRLGIASA